MSLYDDMLKDDDEESLGGGGTPDPVGTIAGPSTQNQAVFDRIQQVRQGTANDPTVGPPAPQNPEPSSPFSQSDIAAMDYAHGAQQDASIGRALNAVASGFGAKVDNSGYDSAVTNANTTANKVMDRSARVAQAVAARALNDKKMAEGKAMFERKQGLAEKLGGSTIEKNLAEAAKARSEAGLGKIPAGVTPDTDPSVLIRSVVPKEKQELVGKEIKRAQDVGQAAPTIIKKMKDAIAETQGLGRIGSFIHSPRSIDALHVALAPTFADLGENARPAIMEQFFKEIDPRGGDTPAEAQGRLASLEEHLKAKASAPIAKTYGIDLNKFNSTKQYEAPKEETDDGVDGYAKQAAKEPAADPQISAWANQHGLSYAQAEGIIAKRKAAAGGS